MLGVLKLRVQVGRALELRVLVGVRGATYVHGQNISAGAEQEVPHIGRCISTVCA